MNNYTITKNDSIDELYLQVDVNTGKFVTENRNLPIHCVMKVDYFLKLVGRPSLGTGTNYLKKLPGNWTDANEAFYYKQEFELEHGETTTLDKWLRGLYGQCWSLNDESDFCYMWEFYGRNRPDDLVQITTTVGKLWDSISSFKSNTSLPNLKFGSIRMGRVGYVPLPMFISFIATNIAQISKKSDLNDVALSSLLMKSSQYRFEREIRLVLSLETNNSSALPKDGITYFISSEKFIDRVVASPFMSQDQFVKTKTELEDRSKAISEKFTMSELFNLHHLPDPKKVSFSKEIAMLMEKQDQTHESNDD